MNNPWKKLAHKPPFILGSDRDYIDPISIKRNGTQYEVRKDLLPEPYIGNKDSEIVLLNLNPGFSDCNVIEHEDPYFRSVLRKNLLHGPLEYPFYYLDPKLIHLRGSAWWRTKLKEPLMIVDGKALASRIFCIEYFPYHSKRYQKLPHSLESQKYSIELVKRATKKKNLIIVMRALARWCEIVPELKDYKNRFELNSPQNVAISRKNCPLGFRKMGNILNG